MLFRSLLVVVVAVLFLVCAGLVDFVGAGWAGEFLVCDGVLATGVSIGWGVFCAEAMALLSCGGL